MLDKKAYTDYLVKKVKNKKIIEEREKFFDKLNEILSPHGEDVLSSSISDFLQCYQWSLVEVQKAFDFLSDYVSFIQAEHPQSVNIAESINGYCMNRFETTGREAATSRKKTILLIPDGVKVESNLLGSLSNDEFVSTFRESQKLIIKTYEDIERSPFDWGYPDFYITDGYYNRVFDFLYAFVCCGELSDGVLTIDTKQFLSFTSVKRHKKPELMITGFERIGFIFNGYDKKSISFCITHPSNPNVIAVMCAYMQSFKENALHWSSAEMMKWSFSYRFVEDASTQKFETVFHSKLDLASEELREIQFWLHDEAEKCGYKIDVSHPYEKNCIQYKKGSKIFLLVGEKSIDGKPIIFSKVIFRDVFISEKEKVKELCDKFPDAFKSNCRLCGGIEHKCNMRIFYEIEGKPHKNCAYQSFVFHNLTFPDIIKLLELFKIENKIK